MCGGEEDDFWKFGFKKKYLAQPMTPLGGPAFYNLDSFYQNDAPRQNGNPLFFSRRS